MYNVDYYERCIRNRDGGSASVNIGIFWSIGIGIVWIEKYSIGIGKNNTDPPSLMVCLREERNIISGYFEIGE